MKKIYIAHNVGVRFKVRDEITPIIEKLYPEYKIENHFLREGRENKQQFSSTITKEEYFAKKDMENQDDNIDYNFDKRNETIVEKDLQQLRDCDMLIAYIEEPSIGTISELFYNSYVLEKPTIVIFPSKIDLFYHLFINYLTDRIIILDELEELN